MDLPRIGPTPERHPDCCLSLSTKLIDTITNIFHQRAISGLVLSIGSGSGLLESLLLSIWSTQPGCELQLEGVEVSNSSGTPINRYLPEPCYSTVKGTWDLSPRAKDAAALLFVYPRHSDLIKSYLGKYHATMDSKLRLVIWLGPKCDWDDHVDSFMEAGVSTSVQILEDCGLAEYEMLAIVSL